MLNRIHRDYCNDQDSTVKTLPKDLNSGFVDSFRLSQVPELNSRCGHLCLIHMYPIVCLCLYVNINVYMYVYIYMCVSDI